jgi:hypothetical protein
LACAFVDAEWPARLREIIKAIEEDFNVATPEANGWLANGRRASLSSAREA